ncbi:hypothetical protein GCM10010096_25540 [Alcaligenes pakistanensis]|uniref:HEPN domain-containing protein n=1 Tax=Alcaligenes pakistanensis TaxID=1482717 RepID=A0A8H9IMS0_9BURK|nr:hypothetical protein [Alcaligenes pakistanensis]GHC52353.1 hypothetical protein GCM10010096_25540 [Alcaligenes pakistanensis]
MSVTPQELMTFADELWRKADCELSHRFAVSKFYYSIYHLCDSEFSCYRLSSDDLRGGVHQRLWEGLKSFECESDFDKQVLLRTIGILGDILRVRRVSADYFLDENINSGDSRLARGHAKDVASKVQQYLTAATDMP